jgi:hypothetical protein
MFGPPARAVTDASIDRGIAKLLQPYLSLVCKFLDNLNTPDPTGKLRQNRRLVTQAGTDLENAF